MRASRIVLAVVLIAHGIGHVLGVLAPSLGDDQWSLRSWLLPDPTPEWIGMVAYAAAAALFVLAGLAAVGILPERNLRRLTETAAIVSLLALLFWWYAFPSIWSNVGAIVVDVVVLVGAFPERSPRGRPRHVGPAPA